MRTAVTRPVLWPREQPASPARRCVRRAGGVHENSDARYGGTRRPPDGRRRRHRPPHPEVFATSTTRQPCHQPPGRVQLAPPTTTERAHTEGIINLSTILTRHRKPENYCFKRTVRMV